MAGAAWVGCGQKFPGGVGVQNHAIQADQRYRFINLSQYHFKQQAFLCHRPQVFKQADGLHIFHRLTRRRQIVHLLCNSRLGNHPSRQLSVFQVQPHPFA